MNEHPPATRRSRAGILVLAMLLAVMTVSPLPYRAKEASCEELPKVLRTGFLATIYHDIDPRDAQAATELLAREISRTMGLATTPRVVLFSDIDSLEMAVRRGELDLVSLPSLDYLRIRDRVSLIPAFVGAHNDGRGTRFLLIARRDSAITSFAHLKGKSLLVLSRKKNEPGRIWLEILLAHSGERNPKAFFGSTREIQKISQGLLSVFFKQADATLATRAAFETSKTLNPQLGRRLMVIEESEYLSDGVTCFPATVPPHTREIISSAINRVNSTATGRQFFTIYQTSGTKPFLPTYLDGLERLLQERNRLGSKIVRWE